MAAVFGDIFMKCVYRMRPYETVAGNLSTAIHKKWEQSMQSPSWKAAVSVTAKFKKMCREMIHEFDPISDQR